jgi:hypothetical protein
MKTATTMTLMLSLLAVTTVGAQETEDSLSKKLANPLAAMISVPVQINFDNDLGANKDGSIFQMNIQPVLPFQISDEWNLITRTILPIIEQDDLTKLSGTDTGIGDVLESFFFSPIRPTASGWVWGAGPALLMPTASEDALGADQWAAGPTFLALGQTGPWTCGLLLNHLWTFAGEDDLDDIESANSKPSRSLAGARGVSSSPGSDINASYVEPWISYGTPIGTTLSLSTECSYDWEASEWLVPLVATADHLFTVGEVPFAAGCAARYWADSPEGGPEGWAARLQVTFLFSK